MVWCVSDAVCQCMSASFKSGKQYFPWHRSQLYTIYELMDSGCMGSSWRFASSKMKDSTLKLSLEIPRGQWMLRNLSVVSAYIVV